MLAAAWRRFSRLAIAPALVIGVLVACDNDEGYDFITDCIKDAVTNSDCNGGDSYTCTGSTIPSDSDPTVVCESAHPGKSGETIFCCASEGTSSATCSADSTVVCASGEIGYYCSGSDTPEQGDPTLECTSSANPSGGLDYCCAHESGAGCTQDADAGCAGGGTTYDCPASVSPQASDPSLSCGPPTLGSDGIASYCCTTH